MLTKGPVHSHDIHRLKVSLREQAHSHSYCTNLLSQSQSPRFRCADQGRRANPKPSARDLIIVCKWLYACADMQLLKIDGDSTFVYLTTDLPWPADTRDMVPRVQTEQIEDGSVIRHLSAVIGMEPVVPGLIRVEQLQGVWQMVPKGERETEVTYQLHAEPAANIPSWLANRFVIDAPTVTLKRLRAVAERQGGIRRMCSADLDAKRLRLGQNHKQAYSAYPNRAALARAPCPRVARQ